MALAFLDRLQPELRAAVVSNATTMRFSPGESIFLPGNHSVAGVVERGLVRISEELPDGTTYAHRHVSPGGVVGLSVLVGRREDISATAIGKVTLLKFNPLTVERLRDAPAFTLAVAREILDRLSDTSSEAALRLRGNLPRRLALELLDLAAEEGGDLPIVLSSTHEAIAEHAGTSREVVTRVLRRLAMRELIRQDGRGRIQILDPERLLAFGRRG